MFGNPNKMRRFLPIAVVALSLVAGTACTGDDDAADTTTTTTRSSATTDAADTTTSPAVDRGRIVALGEEFLLADLLALGIRPVASTATVDTAGFQGIDEADTEGIEPLPSYEADFERLAGLRPDTVIASPFIIEQAGRDKLEAIADIIEMPDKATPTEQITFLGKAFGLEAEAADLVDGLNSELEASKADVPDDCTVSLGTIYSGRNLAAWIAAPNVPATVLLDLGCTLAPSTADAPPDQAGRVYLSEEQLEMLSAPKLILLQTPTVEGEDAARAEMENSPLWGRLPAVAAGEVTVLDRLGYPGIEGMRRLVTELHDIVTV